MLLRGLGCAVGSPSGVWGGDPVANALLVILSLENASICSKTVFLFICWAKVLYKDNTVVSVSVFTIIMSSEVVSG